MNEILTLWTGRESKNNSDDNQGILTPSNFADKKMRDPWEERMYTGIYRASGAKQLGTIGVGKILEQPGTSVRESL